jgi:cytidylate kinase
LAKSERRDRSRICRLLNLFAPEYMSSMPTVFHRVIAIDGPAASGKSSVAREIARRLGFVYVNSGAIYRAITWYVLRKGIAPEEHPKIVQAVTSAKISCQLENNESRVLIDDLDPVVHLRELAVNQAVSRVSAVPEVRHILTDKMREYARAHDLVVEGRDIGSVVFPDTPHKFYIDASPEVRLRRRAAEGQRDEIAARDRVDSSRRAAPLTVASNASVIDTSKLTVDEVVAEIMKQLAAQGLSLAQPQSWL